jgi:hypothetical protein
MNLPPGGILTKLDLEVLEDDDERSSIDGEGATGVSVPRGDLLRLKREGEVFGVGEKIIEGGAINFVLDILIIITN